MNKLTIFKTVKMSGLALCIGLIPPDLPKDFYQRFSAETATAITQLKNYEPQICNAASQFDAEPLTVMAIAAPELIRFHHFRNRREASALEQLYVHLGSREVDFPIGPFQMKPSFVEDLESAIAKYPGVFNDYQFIASYEANSEKEKRRIRLQRIRNMEWQINYAFAFYAVARACFPPQNFKNVEDQIRFYAAAYDLGFKSKVEEIHNWQSEKAFPYGRNYIGRQWSYADLAARFYSDNTPLFACESLCLTP